MNEQVEKVIIASLNPVKINAVEAGFKKLFPDKLFTFEGVSVESEVSDQPMSHEDTKTGAKNRALNAMKLSAKANYWVGIEGGISPTEDGMESFAWIYILSHSRIGTAKTASFFLPPAVAKLVASGLELGTANDMIFNKENSKQKNGAVGLLTNNLMDRTSYYSDAIILALIPFINLSLYPKVSSK